MLKSTMVQLFNEKLAGEMLNYDEIVPYLDAVVNEINADLSSKFPIISSFNATQFPGYKAELYTSYDAKGNLIIDTAKQNIVYNNYDCFPDKYIMSVLIPGAAFKWFSVDEEGASTAPLFQQEYEKGRFEMVRDYMDLVPYEYVNDLSGAISDPFYYSKYVNESEAFGVF